LDLISSVSLYLKSVLVAFEFFDLDKDKSTCMAKDDLAQLEGQIVDAAAGGIYKVKLENDVQISAKLCGKMRRFNIRKASAPASIARSATDSATNGCSANKWARKSACRLRAA
jgi:hypothetical protein